MRTTGIILLMLVAATSQAQTTVDTTYQVELTVTASPMFNFFRNPRVPGTDDKTSVGGGVSVRAMWHPGRLLSLGLLTGYSIIATDEIPAGGSSAVNYSARLAAVPLQLALSMQKYNVELGMGIGPYLMMTTIEGGNSAPAHGSRLELGMTFFASYAFSLSDRIMIAPELRVLSFRYRGILSVMPSCSFRLNALRY